MSIFLQNPAFLGLLALAGLPLLVHLLSRARPPEYRFSNLDFLRRVMRRTARIRRPKDWLLLALRTLAMAALAAAFISPFLVSKNAALPGEKTTTILLIDRSASMAAREGAGSRFDTACAEAARFLEESRPDAANVVWIDAEPQAEYPAPGPNLEYLGDQLKTAEPRPETGSLAAGFDLAVHQLSSLKGHRELIIISDFQASAWRDFEPSLPPDIQIRTHRVATTAPANLAIVRLLTQPSAPVVGQDMLLLVSVRNFSPDPVRKQLTLDADGALQSQAIDLPPWGEAETSFQLRPAKAGPLPVSASIDADAFPGDDTRHSVVHVRDAIRIAGASSAISNVISAIPWLEASERPEPGDIQVLTKWNDPAVPRQLAESGTTVVIHSCLGGNAAPLDALLGKTPKSESSTKGWKILPNEEHPANQLFRGGDFGNPFAGTFRERLKLGALPENARLIASYSDGVPAILEFTGKHAPVLFFNLSLDPEKSDWADQGTFLPAFAEVILRTRPNTTLETTQIPSGTRLSHRSNTLEQSSPLILIGKDATQYELEQSTTREGVLWQSVQRSEPGLYQWQISGQSIDLSAVNFPESESDLRPLDKAPGFGKRSSAINSLARQAALSQGIPLWPWLLLGGLVCLLIESLIQLQSSRTATA